MLRYVTTMIFSYLKLILCISLLHTNYTNGYSQLLGNDILQNRKSSTIPFKYISGFIIVNITFNNLPLNFIFDTGATNTILFKKELTDAINTEYTDTIPIMGADISNFIDAYVVRNGKFKLENNPNYIKRDFIILSENILELDNSIGIPVAGILGADFFKRLTVKIDYRKKRITLLNPDYFIPSKKYEKLPIQIINGKPYLKSKLSLGGKPHLANLLLDTGANISLLLHPNYDKIKLPINSISAFLGKGLSGPIIGHIGLINNIKIGTYQFDDLLVNFQNTQSDTLLNQPLIRDGLIGNQLLSKFNLVIDYTNSSLHIKSNKYYNSKMAVNRSGLIIHAYGKHLNEFVVQYVYPNSQADSLNIKKGDIITKLNKCKGKRLTLQKINNKLSGKAGKIIKLNILRDNHYIDFSITLQDLIKKEVSYSNSN